MGHNLGQDAKLKRGAKRGVESRMEYGAEHGVKIGVMYGVIYGVKNCGVEYGAGVKDGVVYTKQNVGRNV